MTDIEILESLKSYTCKPEVVDKAIKALEQEPCDDAISKQVVKEQMIKYGFHAPDMTVTEFVEDILPEYHKGYADAKAMRESMLYEMRATIESKCDRINSLSSVLPYAAHREIQELLCEIMELFEPQESEVRNE